MKIHSELAEGVLTPVNSGLILPTQVKITYRAITPARIHFAFIFASPDQNIAKKYPGKKIRLRRPLIISNDLFSKNLGRIVKTKHVRASIIIFPAFLAVYVFADSAILRTLHFEKNMRISCEDQ